MALAWLPADEWRALLERGRLRGRGLLRVVRPGSVPGRRGQRLDAAVASALRAPAYTRTAQVRAAVATLSDSRLCARAESSRARRTEPRLPPASPRVRRRGRTSSRRPVGTPASGRPPCATRPIRRPARVVETGERHAEDRAHRGAHRLRPCRIRAARRTARRMRARTHRPCASSVPTFPGSPTCHSESPTSGSSERDRSSRRKTPITRGA